MARTIVTQGIQGPAGPPGPVGPQGPASPVQSVVGQQGAVTAAQISAALGLGSAAALAAGGPGGAAVLDASGNASALNVLATGGSTTASLAAVAANAAPVVSPIGQTSLRSSSALGAPLLWAGNDIIPEIHLSNLYGNSSPVLAMIGDSTGTPGDAMGNPNGVDPSQVLWAAVKNALRRQNPQATWNFDTANNVDAGNFCIGGTSWSHVLETGSALAAGGVALPSWFTNTALTWLATVQASNPDILIFDMGINFADQGFTATVPAGSNALVELQLILAGIATWAKVPNILFITNKVINRNITSGSGNFAPTPIEAYRGVAGAIRTFCKSSGALFTSGWPANMQQFGLIDCNRSYHAKVWGIDVANQYLKAQPPSVVNGLSLTSTAFQFGTTTDGDFAFTLVFSATASALNSAGAGTIDFNFNGWSTQKLRLIIGTTGTVAPRYSPTVVIGSNAIQGATVTPSGNLTVTVAFRGEHLQVYIGSTLSLDAKAPRFVNGGPVTILSVSAPTSAITFNVTEFYEGFGTKTPIAFTDDYAWGGYGNSAATFGGACGGNGENHPPSHLVAAIDYQVLESSNLKAPRGQIFAEVEQLVTPTSGATVQMANNTGVLVIQGSTTLAALTIALPTQPVNRQPIEIIFQIAVTALTISAPSGYTVVAPVTSATAGQHTRFKLVTAAWS